MIYTAYKKIFLTILLIEERTSLSPSVATQIFLFWRLCDSLVLYFHFPNNHIIENLFVFDIYWTDSCDNRFFFKLPKTRFILTSVFYFHFRNHIFCTFYLTIALIHFGKMTVHSNILFSLTAFTRGGYFICPLFLIRKRTTN